MTLFIIAVLVGLILLVYGAERFVYGAAGTANALGVSPRDMIDILKSIKAAGALHAEFVVR